MMRALSASDGASDFWGWSALASLTTPNVMETVRREGGKEEKELTFFYHLLCNVFFTH